MRLYGGHEYCGQQPANSGSRLRGGGGLICGCDLYANLYGIPIIIRFPWKIQAFDYEFPSQEIIEMTNIGGKVMRNITWPNELTSVMKLVKRWTLVRLTAEFVMLVWF